MPLLVSKNVFSFESLVQSVSIWLVLLKIGWCELIIGIDLGTTNSLVSYMSPDGPQLIPNALGETLTPSVVALDHDDRLIVGRAALEFQVTNPGRCAAVFKRNMGTDWTCRLDDSKREFNSIQLSSLVLRSLREDAEAFLKTEITQAVITVPAYFNENQRTATIRAGEVAELSVERILNEPTAAAIAYGLHQAKEDKTVLVFDLGGGTFDVSIVELFDGMLEIRSSSGETFLGGEDFTTTLTSNILKRHGRLFEPTELEHPQMVSRLRKECERAKCKLTTNPTATVRVPNTDGTFNDPPEVETITCDELTAWTAQILSRIERPLRRALSGANLKRTDIDEVVLVGGATRMPMVRNRVREFFEAEPHCSLDPDEVIANGAAIQAALIGRDESVEDLVVTDVAPFTLGVETIREIGLQLKEGYFLPILDRNTTIPVSRVQRVSTIVPNQPFIKVRVFQGESRMVDDNLFITEFEVKGFPKGPAGQEADIRFTYDLNGVLEVEVEIVKTKHKVSHVVTRYTKGLSKNDVKKAVKEMKALKTHPREESENRYLLHWADRIFQELPPMLRDQLDMLVTGFESAMELQDDSISEHRQALRQFLSAFDTDMDHDPDDLRESSS
jgi:molecular chaperone HscC